MDTDDARRASEEIYRRIQRQTGLGRSGSAGDVALLPEAAETIIGGRTGHQREIGEQIRTSTTSSEDQLTQAEDTAAGAVGGTYTANYTPMFHGGGTGRAEPKSLPTAHERSGIKTWNAGRGAKPKMIAPLTTQTIQEEA